MVDKQSDKSDTEPADTEPKDPEPGGPDEDADQAPLGGEPDFRPQEPVIETGKIKALPDPESDAAPETPPQAAAKQARRPGGRSQVGVWQGRGRWKYEANKLVCPEAVDEAVKNPGRAAELHDALREEVAEAALFYSKLIGEVASGHCDDDELYEYRDDLPLNVRIALAGEWITKGIPFMADLDVIRRGGAPPSGCEAATPP